MEAEKLQEVANQKFDFKAFKQTLKEKIQAHLTVTHNSGLFKACPETITFVHVLNQSNTEFIYLSDEYDNPIQANGKELYRQLIEAHQYAVNAWYIEYEASRKIRNLNV